MSESSVGHDGHHHDKNLHACCCEALCCLSRAIACTVDCCDCCKPKEGVSCHDESASCCKEALKFIVSAMEEHLKCLKSCCE